MSDRFTRLLHPAFLLALTVLLVNDHVLKDAFGNVLTGKLSDVAGLIVLPVFLTTVLRIQSRQLVWSIHGLVGLAFAAVQFVPDATLWALGVPVRHTPDPTDLLALAVLPFGVRLSLSKPRQHEWMRPALANAVGLVAVGAVLATSPPRAPLVVEPTPVLTASSPEDAIDQLEQRLEHLGMEVRGGQPPAYPEWVAAHPTYDDGDEAREVHARLVEGARAERSRGMVAYWLHVPPAACREPLPETGLGIELATEWDINEGALSVVVSSVEAEGLRWRFADDQQREQGRQLVQACLMDPLRVLSG